MAADWPVFTLNELQADDGKAIAIGPFGSKMKSSCYVATGVPVIRGMNISDTRVLSNDFVYITEQKADELKSCCAFADDLFFPHRGSIGEVGIVPEDGFERYVLSSSIMKLTCNRTVVEPLFLFYYFRSSEGRHEILRFGSTVGTPGIGQPLSSLKQMRVPLPPLPEQRAIAKILGSLDDKIELNRRMNETLEGIARALFKSWFVDFDPVRAKMDGRQPNGMSPQIANLFPSEFEHVNGELMPKGWKAAMLGEVLEIHDSKRIPLSGRERKQRSGRYPYYGAASVMDHVDDYLFDGIYVLMGEDGSVVKEDGTPVLQYVWGKFWVNNHAHVLRGVNGVSEEHLLLHLQQCNITPFVTGAVQPKLNQGNMKQIDFLLASEAVCKAFAASVSPAFARIRANSEESKVLSSTRDTLLPKLLSGELRVSEADKMLVEVL